MIGPVIDVENRAKTVVVCEDCGQKVRIPRSRTKLRITCPTCRNEFTYQYYAAGLSSYHLKPLLVGLAGAVLGFVAGELMLTSRAVHFNDYLTVPTVCAAFGVGLGAVLDGAEGFLRRDRARAWYAFQSGAPTGIVAGVIAGLIAQLVYATFYRSVALVSYHTGYWTSTTILDPPFPQLLVARILSWCVMGVGMGAVYGIAGKKWSVARAGLIGGAIGGAVGGLLFELASTVTRSGNGMPGRLLGLAALGMGLGLALFRPRTAAVRRKVLAGYLESDGPQEAWMTILGVVLALVGLAVTVAGAYLYLGNTEGTHPTFPYSGCITLNIGVVILFMGLFAIKEWFTGRS